MNNFIIISRTFTETTPESAEHGDFSNHGFISEREEVTFTELVDLMEKHTESSGGYGTHVWYSGGTYTSCYRTATEREESIHFHRDNTENAAKYWKWARLAANKRINKRRSS